MSEMELVEEEDGPGGRLGKAEKVAIAVAALAVLGVLAVGFALNSGGSASDSPAAAASSPPLSPADGPCVNTVMPLLWQDLVAMRNHGPMGGLNDGTVAQQYGLGSKVWVAFTDGNTTALADTVHQLNTNQDLNDEINRLLPVVRQNCK